MSEYRETNRGRDFLIGFLAALGIAILAIVLAFTANGAAPLVIGGLILAFGAVAAFLAKRPLVGAGICTLVVISPLLLIGSCFALLSFG